MRFTELVLGSRDVAKTRGRNEKVAKLAALVGRLEPAERAIGVGYLAGELPQGRIGVGYRTVSELATTVPRSSERESPSLVETDRVLTEVAHAKGPGSQGRRATLLANLYGNLDEPERQFLSGLLVGEIRQGALAAILLEAVALVTRVPSADLRRAAMLSGSDLEAMRVALDEGRAGLLRFKLAPFTPIKPMLASVTADASEALAAVGEARFEAKLDGARLQMHKDGDDVRLYSRSLHDVTARCPEIVRFIRELPVRRAILDGEAIAMRSGDGRPHAFQTTMRRFGRTKGVEALGATLPLSAFVFDAVLLDDDELMDEPLRTRSARLLQFIPEHALVPSLLTADADEADAFYAHILERGHEGLMVKSLTSAYDAGRRGSQWLKWKPTHTYDLVVLAVERGSGRRSEWLSNIHLGARDPASGGFAMIGKTFKGMTDEMLAWQTRRFTELAVSPIDGWVTLLRPEQVVEIAFNDVQRSAEYTSGAALRFARVRRYRDDKTAADAATIEEIRALLPDS